MNRANSSISTLGHAHAQPRPKTPADKLPSNVFSKPGNTDETPDEKFSQFGTPKLPPSDPNGTPSIRSKTHHTRSKSYHVERQMPPGMPATLSLGRASERRFSTSDVAGRPLFGHAGIGKTNLSAMFGSPQGLIPSSQTASYWSRYAQASSQQRLFSPDGPDSSSFRQRSMDPIESHQLDSAATNNDSSFDATPQPHATSLEDVDMEQQQHIPHDRDTKPKKLFTRHAEIKKHVPTAYDMYDQHKAFVEDALDELDTIDDQSDINIREVLKNMTLTEDLKNKAFEIIKLKIALPHSITNWSGFVKWIQKAVIVDEVFHGILSFLAEFLTLLLDTPKFLIAFGLANNRVLLEKDTHTDPRGKPVQKSVSLFRRTLPVQVGESYDKYAAPWQVDLDQTMANLSCLFDTCGNGELETFLQRVFRQNGVAILATHDADILVMETITLHGRTFRIIGRDIACGGQGRVCLAFEDVDRDLWCLKLCENPTQAELQEVEYGKKLLDAQEYVVTPLLSGWNGHRIVHVLKPQWGGSMASFYRSYGNIKEEALLQKIVRDIVESLYILHNHKNIANRDLKPQNLLIDCWSVVDGRVKIGDFGFACPASAPRRTTAVGTPGFRAPELLSRTGMKHAYYDAMKADTWSLGATMYSLLTGRCPLDEDNPVDRFGHLNINTVLPDISDDLFHLLFACLLVPPESRYTVRQIQKHDWVRRKFDPEWKDRVSDKWKGKLRERRQRASRYLNEVRAWKETGAPPVVEEKEFGPVDAEEIAMRTSGLETGSDSLESESSGVQSNVRNNQDAGRDGVAPPSPDNLWKNQRKKHRNATGLTPLMNRFGMTPRRSQHDDANTSRERERERQRPNKRRHSSGLTSGLGALKFTTDSNEQSERASGFSRFSGSGMFGQQSNGFAGLASRRSDGDDAHEFGDDSGLAHWNFGMNNKLGPSSSFDHFGSNAAKGLPIAGDHVSAFSNLSGRDNDSSFGGLNTWMDQQQRPSNSLPFGGSQFPPKSADMHSRQGGSEQQRFGFNQVRGDGDFGGSNIGLTAMEDQRSGFEQQEEDDDSDEEMGGSANGNGNVPLGEKLGKATPSLLECPVCHEKFGSDRTFNFKRHCAKHVFEQLVVGGRVFVCNLKNCTASFNRADRLRTHYNDHMENGWEHIRKKFDADYAQQKGRMEEICKQKLPSVFAQQD